MGNEWIDFVKLYAKDHNLKYNEALKEAGKSYKEMKGKVNKTNNKIRKLNRGKRDISNKKKIVESCFSSARRDGTARFLSSGSRHQGRLMARHREEGSRAVERALRCSKGCSRRRRSSLRLRLIPLDEGKQKRKGREKTHLFSLSLLLSQFPNRWSRSRPFRASMI